MKQRKIPRRARTRMRKLKLNEQPLATSPKVYDLISRISKIHSSSPLREFLLDLFKDPKILEKAESLDIDSILHSKDAEDDSSLASRIVKEFFGDFIFNPGKSMQGSKVSEEVLTSFLRLMKDYSEEWNLLHFDDQLSISGDFFTSSYQISNSQYSEIRLGGFLKALKKHKQTWLLWSKNSHDYTDSLLTLYSIAYISSDSKLSFSIFDTVFTKVSELLKKYPDMESVLGTAINEVITSAAQLIDFEENIFEEVLVALYISMKRYSDVFKRVPEIKGKFAGLFIEVWLSNGKEKAMEFLEIISLLSKSKSTSNVSLLQGNIEECLRNLQYIVKDYIKTSELGSLTGIQRAIAYFASLDYDLFYEYSREIFENVSKDQFDSLCPQLAYDNPILVQKIGERLFKEKAA